MKIDINDKDQAMLLKMVERGWAEGDLGEYLNGDQIQSCIRVLRALGLSEGLGLDPKAHSPSRHPQRQGSQAAQPPAATAS